jgi:hypothetical protein
MSQQQLSPAEMLEMIVESATKTVQGQNAEVAKAAERLGRDVAERPAGDHSLTASAYNEAKEKHEGMAEILRIINGFRSGLYVNVRSE